MKILKKESSVLKREKTGKKFVHGADWGYNYRGK